MDRPRQILIVEDSETQALRLGALLEEMGHATAHAASAEEGLAFLGRHAPDLIVVDYHLPGMEGNEFCRLIRERSGLDAIPLLMLTEEVDADVEREVLEAGADDFVKKSAGTEVLLARIDALFRKPRPESVLSPAGGTFYRSQRVIVVDDSATYLAFLEQELKQESYEVASFERAEAALDALGSGDFDCLVVDLMMPGMDGIELCRRVRATSGAGHATVPILMVTGHESKEEMMRALEAGADDFVTKSSEPLVLKARMRALLRRKSLHDEHERILTEFRNKELEVVRERAERQAAEARARLAEELEAAYARLENINRELREAQSQLVQSAKMASLGELVAGIAHEVNNPLAFSISHVGTAGNALAALEGELEGRLSEDGARRLAKARLRIADAGDGLARVRDLMTKLRTFSRLDEGEFKFADIQECVESALALVSHRLSDGITVVEDYAEDNRLYCSPGTLNQVILNLLSNATDAIEGDGEIRLSTRREADHFLISVADNGPGVPAEIRERIFEPFFTTKDVGHGTGLGLAIGYRIVHRQHRGTLEVGESAAGGAAFTIRIPLNLEERIDEAA